MNDQVQEQLAQRKSAEVQLEFVRGQAEANAANGDPKALELQELRATKQRQDDEMASLQQIMNMSDEQIVALEKEQDNLVEKAGIIAGQGIPRGTDEDMTVKLEAQIAEFRKEVQRKEADAIKRQDEMASLRTEQETMLAKAAALKMRYEELKDARRR